LGDRLLCESIAAIEIARRNLQVLLLEKAQASAGECGGLDRSVPGIPGALVFWDGHVLRFVVPEVPLPKDVCGHRKIPKGLVWRSYLVHAYRQAELTIRFERALCIIVVYLPVETSWDVDNRAYEDIVNTLWLLRVVPDDSWKHLALAVVGKCDPENPRTEVWVGDSGDPYILEVLAGVLKEG
jgi:hypothetical protein